MADYYPKTTERLQLTNHDVLGISSSSSRYSANLEEVSLDADPSQTQGPFSATENYASSGDASEPLNAKPETKTDRILLILFGITTADLHGLGKILIICFTISVAILIGLIIHILWGPPQIQPHGAVATDVHVCSSIGVDILKDGGSAVDAAIAALFCLGVVNPQSAGIGGGGFALIYHHKKPKSSYYVDFRETAPAAFKSEMMEELKTKPVLAIGVPGELRGLHDIHALYGKLRWADLILPSVKLARDGFEVTKALEDDLWRFDRFKGIPSSERLKKFLYPEEKPLKAGQKIKRPEFATTLEKIAYNGAGEFYSGHLSKEILTEVQSHGGILTEADLVAYNVSVQEPIKTSFNGYTVMTSPPPSSGAALLLSLNMLEGFNLTKDDINSPLFWHRFIEVSKFEFSNRNRLGDPKFESTMDALVKNMIAKNYAEILRLKIQDDKVLENYGDDVKQPDPFGTTHVSVVDNNELYVTITSTLNNFFGSGVMTASGIVLNDELADFASANDTAFEQANSPAPGKRPLSSMVPTIVFHPNRDCTKRIAIGGSNGTHIPGGVLNSLLNILVFGLNVTDAIEHSRVFADKPTNPVLVETGLGQEIIAKLKTFGHKISEVPGLSVVQAVMKDNKTITAHSDSRKHGDAEIY